MILQKYPVDETTMRKLYKNIGQSNNKFHHSSLSHKSQEKRMCIIVCFDTRWLCSVYANISALGH